MPLSDHTIPFRVDLRGVVDLLSRHIYSSPHVFLRELLQNARDALVARHEYEQYQGGASPTYDDGVLIVPVSGESAVFILRDYGIGLQRDEVTELLATVGRSSKHDEFDMPDRDFLGQFGIGLLSCFMVADEILVRSRSARGGAPIEWVGSSDGTFTVRELSELEVGDFEIGTEVVLVPRPDDAALLATDTVVALARKYAEFLELPIRVAAPDGRSEIVNRRAPFLAPLTTNSAREEAAEFGRELLGESPFDVIELDIPETVTRGMAFVLPYAPPPGSRQASRVYLGRMLVTERLDDLLPDWSFFVRVCVDSTGLDPTASREQLIENEALQATRELIGASIRRWILQLAATHPARLLEFIAIHGVALKAVVLHDDELARCLVPWFVVETSIGHQRVGDLATSGAVLRYAATVDEFRQISALAPRDAPIINGGYVYDSEVLRRLPFLFERVTVERVSVAGEIDRLEAPLLIDRAAVASLERRASVVLDTVATEVVARCFSPHDLPALYVSDPEILREIEREKAREATEGLWRSVVTRLEIHAAGNASNPLPGRARAQLCLNWNNHLARLLAEIRDESVFARSIQLLYVQALLASHRPLRPVERSMLTTALGDLVTLSLNPLEGIKI